MTTTATPNAAAVRYAFQQTAEFVGGDILQCCRDCGEPERIDRNGLFDYLSEYGGEQGLAVYRWVLHYPGTLAELEAELDAMQVPRIWT